MIAWALRSGERLRPPQIAGLALAIVGLIALVFPGLSAPPLDAAVLMLGAGIAWAVYSLRGKGGGDPLGATAGNFLRAAPMAALLSVVMLRSHSFDLAGMCYAIASGALASGVGYAIWYTALPALKASGAATVQLSVPVLAATGGIIFLGEQITLRFVVASIAVLGGIALVIIERRVAVS
jgi:drug/metabolite transporter (DMT)-like permease